VFRMICSSKIGISNTKNNETKSNKNSPNNCSIRNVQGKFRTIRPLWHPYLRIVINDFFKKILWKTFCWKSQTFNNKIILENVRFFVLLQSFLKGSYKSYKVL
jgi:hypothetical protein